MKKRLLASFLSLVLILGLLPTAALAVDEDFGYDHAYGDSGEKNSWDVSANSDGSVYAYLTENEGDSTTYTLNIEGTGAMKNFAYNDLPNWNDYVNSITVVVIQDRVTSIGARSFAGCENLDISTSVTIPNSVTAIGSQAFLNTKANGTFTIPAAVTEIGQPVFSQCSGLTGFSLEDGNKSFIVVDDVLFSGDGTTLMCYPDGKTDESYTIPDGVTTIGASAIVHNNSLKSVAFNDVTELGNNAFDYTALTSVDTTQIQTMGTGAFRGTNVTEVTVGDVVGVSMFMNCIGLKSVTFDGASYQQIPDRMFQGCSSLTSISLPGTITRIGTYAFSDTGLTSVDIPASVETLDNYAFYTCQSLNRITLHDGLETIGDHAFGAYEDGCAITELTIPGTVTSIGAEAFDCASSLEAVTFEAGESEIKVGASAFQNDAALETITVKKNASFGNTAFYNCGALNELTLTGEISFGTNAFSGRYTDTNYTNCPTPYAIDLTQVTSLTGGPSFVTNAANAETNAMIYYVSSDSILNSVKELYSSYGVEQFAYADTNEGIFPESTFFEAGKLAEPIRDGYKFDGWYTDSDCTTALGNGTPTEGQTYYAKWVASTEYSVANDHKTITLDEQTYGYSDAPSATVTVTGPTNDTEILKAVSSNDAFVVSPTEKSTDMTVTVTAANGLDAGTYTGTVYIYTGDGATHWVNVSLTVKKATPKLTLSNSSGSVLSNAGTTTFTYTYYGDGRVSVTSSNGAVATAAVSGNEVTVTVLKAGTANITVSAAAGRNYEAATDATYALTVNQYTEPSTPSRPSTPTPSDDSDPTYSISLPGKVHGGEISLPKRYAEQGETVTITATPDEGYALDDLTVTDANGNEISVRSRGNNQYTFTMPRSRVTVEATFAEIEEEPDLFFVDVPTSAYYYDAVYWAAENGVTYGTSATTFSPDVIVSRAQMVTFLWRAHGSPEPRSSVNPFTDVSSSAYYYDAVLWAVENGVTNGTSATTFSPDATVTRAQAVTFQWRAAGSPAVSGGSFADVADSAYYAGAVSWAVANGVTNGTGGSNFSPDVGVSRAQAVTFLWRQFG